MKFEAELDYLSGHLRTGKLVGEFTEAEFQEWLTLDSVEQQEMLWDYGSVQVTDYCIDDCGGLNDVKFISPQTGDK